MLLLAVTFLVAFQEPTPSTPAPASVRWSAPPRIETPPKALQDKVSGVATLRCAFTNGAPTACRIIAESPAGYGFGMAALRATRSARAANGLDGQHEFSVAFEVR
nr:hypothetical protein [Brevundimonas diminuta]